ncbi:preprotein translocase subunit SecD [Megasphaera cerevisiae DSM 20462]|jgi:preprotein translocase subunit SecD|uniref:Protein translocase subunit SecD n=1 Tax=Megasphaera cerevisiae DSM 20462 TaxID=1122219 RepID=A0A0J6WVD8_9FIRM|nr:protein translocase subunit SecD [Megasphaera cerevisiae]KMO85782.1 preprotein translocase subunit SecD [Megasphaera cerevisiae DSM 20462]MCI1751010.1 protein translocase subunit SecD [Megasphaera cerevisiae]OKY53538.1 protein-export membrane protein SecD [Megasphaera cerevisiae]
MVTFFGAVIIILAVFITFIYPLANSIKQGLDLQGGTHIVLEAEDTADAPVTEDSLNRAVSIIERRINEMGLTEPIVQKEGARRIIVELPGEKNPEKAIETIGKTAVMEFKDESGTTRMTGKDLKTAKEEIDNGHKNVVAIEFTDEGAKKFADLTASNVGHKISILLDGEVLTSPVVNEPITGGKAVITGSKTLEEAKSLAILLRSGALPVKLKVMEVRTIGPSLGQDSKIKSEKAFAIGIILIMIFLIVIYRMSGIVANVALLVYVLILLAILKYLDATLTLPGIAGIILSMGFAVDANILIFERFKEEVLIGKSLRTSMEAGFKRAFSTILDANVSVMIAAIVLIVMGSGTVKGFAVNLALGIVVSMFTAILVSRSLLTWFINTNLITNPWFYGLNRKVPEHMLKKGGQK